MPATMTTEENHQDTMECNSEVVFQDMEEDEVDRAPGPYTHYEVSCPTVGMLNVYVQGTRSPTEVVVLTVHDLGCNYTQYQKLINHDRMQGIRNKTVWVHVSVPGQEPDAPDLPAGFVFPKMQILAEELIHVLDKLNLKEVVCFGEGAGANILARFAAKHIDRVLGVVLIHCTGTTAGFMEAVRDKVIGWKLDNIGMNPTAEAYLVLHRFGANLQEFASAQNREQLAEVIEHFQSSLRSHTNPKNLKKFVEAFLKRTNISDNIGKITCPVLMLTGQKASFNNTTHALYTTLVKQCKDKAKVEFVQVAGVANVLEEKPEKLIESLQYFMQGLGLVSSLPMHNVGRPLRVRTLSMEEYDQPRLRRESSGSGGGGPHSPISSSPPTGGVPLQPVNN